MRLLLAHAATDVNQARTDDGTTPLFKACQNGHEGVVRLLLEHGADKSIETTKPAGWTALRIAEDEGHIEVAALLR